ncbi:aminotransferase class I/II-fold pyridoxal phosphate-dependent enzyme, partial [Mesorhizobium sp. M4A.F.Ca.ET.029.04.2.1]
MNEAPLARYDATLRGLARKDRLRTLSPRAGLDFSSNDYLGLAASKRLGDAVAAAIAQGTPVGATGSRLLRGNAPEHEQLEADAATFFGAERALFFGSGYIANFALLTALPQKGDLLVLDELAHASMHEGACAGRAEFKLAAHND